MNFDLSVIDVTSIVGVLGVIAFVVAVIVQMTKSIPLIVKIPTQLYAIILSQIVTLVAFFGYANYSNFAVKWYYVALVIFSGFVVAMVATDGWASVKTLWNRFTAGTTE